MGARALTAVFAAHLGSPPPGLAWAIIVILVFDGSSGQRERTAKSSNIQVE
jgi:hypothetical protein